jgi:hypothetical protein
MDEENKVLDEGEKTEEGKGEGQQAAASGDAAEEGAKGD